MCGTHAAPQVVARMRSISVQLRNRAPSVFLASASAGPRTRQEAVNRAMSSSRDWRGESRRSRTTAGSASFLGRLNHICEQEVLSDANSRMVVPGDHGDKDTSDPDHNRRTYGVGTADGGLKEVEIRGLGRQNGHLNPDDGCFAGPSSVECELEYLDHPRAVQERRGCEDEDARSL